MGNNLEQEFGSYNQAVALKELGAGFPYIAWYLPNNPILILHPAAITTADIPAPLKSQVFRWFREKYDLFYDVSIIGVTAADKSGSRYKWDVYNYSFIEGDSEIIGYLTYEEAENACIDKLIELVKQS
jgi:hypothetical protein